MRSEESEQSDLLKKLASKAKRKLNKALEMDVSNERRLGDYEFVESDRGAQRKKLEKKIAQLLKSNPDCDNPIGKLIDHSVFDSLTEERKQAYILKLSKDFAEISQKFR